MSLAAHVSDYLGQACTDVELVADRRGSRVFRVRLSTGDVALKRASPNTENQGVREHLARREAAVLIHLHEFVPGYLLVSGDLPNNGGSWLALCWLDGVTPYRLFTSARRGDDSPARRDSIRHTAAAIADRLAALQSRGWRHADLQPAHILLGANSVHLIDFALAQGSDPLLADLPYRGGMVHFTAPETAACLLATPDDQSIAFENVPRS